MLTLNGEQLRATQSVHADELSQAMAYVELSTGDEFLNAYEYARLSGVELHPIPSPESLPCPDTTDPTESTPPANNAEEHTAEESSAPIAA